MESTYAFPLSYTHSYSRYSCISAFYYLHVTVTYFLILIGIAAMVTRVWSRFQWLHVWFGRIYLVGMFYAFATSVIIHTNGLPLPIMFLFVVLLVSLAVGFIAIKFHESSMTALSVKAVETLLNRKLMSNIQQHDRSVLDNLNPISPPIDLQSLLTQQRAQIADEKSFTERFFSMKALHGLMMALSWWQLFGNAMVRNVFHHYDCWTQPAWKNVTSGVVEFVPQDDPNYKLKGIEGKFFGLVFAGCLGSVLLVGIIYSYFAARAARNRFTL